MMKFRIVKGALTFKNTQQQHRSKAPYRFNSAVTQLQPNFNTYTYIHTYIQPDAAVPVSVSINTASQPVSQRLEPESEPEQTHTYLSTNVANGYFII